MSAQEREENSKVISIKGAPGSLPLSEESIDEVIANLEGEGEKNKQIAASLKGLLCLKQKFFQLESDYQKLEQDYQELEQGQKAASKQGRILRKKEIEAYKVEIADLRVVIAKKDNTIRGLENEIGIDPLTGTYNSAKFNHDISYLIRGIMDHQRKDDDKPKDFSLLFMDIDHFKDFNDTYDHITGDEVLRETTRRAKSELHRSEDKLYRYGGEEFVVILPYTSKEDAAVIAERIKSTMAKEEFSIGNDEKVPLTMSIGVAHFPIDMDDINSETYECFFRVKENREKYYNIRAIQSRGEYEKISQEDNYHDFSVDLLKHAVIEKSDRAMYKAKSEGRNRVCVD